MSYTNVSLPFNLAISLLGYPKDILLCLKRYLYHTTDISISGKLGIVQKPPMRKRFKFYNHRMSSLESLRQFIQTPFLCSPTLFLDEAAELK